MEDPYDPDYSTMLPAAIEQISARFIQELTGADLYAIKTERYYHSAFMGTAAAAWLEEAFDMRLVLAVVLSRLWIFIRC